MGQHCAAAGGGTSSAAARSIQRPCWAESPRAVSCNSDTDEEGRSRSRERREMERQECHKTTRDVVEGRQRTIRDAMARGAG